MDVPVKEDFVSVEPLIKVKPALLDEKAVEEVQEEFEILDNELVAPVEPRLPMLP